LYRQYVLANDSSNRKPVCFIV